MTDFDTMEKTVPQAVARFGGERRRAPRSTLYRPDARFVAHLVAALTDAPQPRSKRRGTSAEAVSAYETTAALRPAVLRVA